MPKYRQKWVIKIGLILNSGHTKKFFHLGIHARVSKCMNWREKYRDRYKGRVSISVREGIREK